MKPDITAIPLVGMVSNYAGGKARQLRRDAMLIAFIGLMVVLASGALLAAFAAWIAGTYGAVVGTLAAASLAILLAVLAMIVRSLMRMAAKRRQGRALSGNVRTLGVAAVTSLVAKNKGAAIVAALAMAALAAYAARSDDD